MRFDTDLEDRYESDAVLSYLEDWYHVPVLAAILAYMLHIRTKAYDEFVREGDVLFRGNDAYYHFRATMYSVRNWPRRLYADPWTHFPYGTTVGNFGSLFDQVVATVALIVGLGDPTARQVAIIAVVTPAVVGALCALVVYGIAWFVTGSRVGGLVAAALLVLVPSRTWVSRTTVGFYDHHAPEALMMALSVLAVLYALRVARRERPVYEQVQDGDWEGLRPTLTASALAGLAVGAYIHVWAPGMVIVGVLALFTVLAASVHVVRGESPEYLAFVGVTLGVVGALTVLPWVRGLNFSNSEMSLLQVSLLLGLGAGAAFLAWLARYWDEESLEPQHYPLGVAAIGAVSLGILWVLLPDLINSILNGLDRVVLFRYDPTRATVGEATPMDTDNLGSAFYQQYGFAFFTAVLGAAWMAGRGLFGRRSRAAYLLLPVWSAVLLSMAITQVRFNYYLVLAVAVLNGWVAVQVLDLVEFPSLDAGRIETHHVLTVVTLVLVLFLPIVVGLSGGVTAPTAAENANQTGPGSVQTWKGNLDWMEENTPEPGQYGGADGSMEYYGPFEPTEDYEYPEGTVGVMSWWDYGHWITVEGERVPNANPFQQGPRTASAFLQETNETRANMYLEALPADQNIGGRLWNISESDLESTIENRTEQEADEETRYVMIDGQMAGGKFSPITEWAGPDIEAYRETQTVQLGGQDRRLPGLSQQYDRTMLSRLYHGDAAGLEHYRLVRESEEQTAVVSAAYEQGGAYEPLFVGLDLRTINQQFPSIYRAIVTGSIQNSPVELYDIRQASAVKTYERVEGATITGQVGANETVTAQVPVETNTGRQFTYLQRTRADEDGQFELTVPYPTDDQLGPEDGYTDSAVEANGTYSLQAGGFFQPSAQAQDVEVPEPAVYEGGEIEVELEPVETDGGNESTSDAEASGSAAASGTDDATGGSGDDGAGGGDDGDAATGSDAERASAPVARVGA